MADDDTPQPTPARKKRTTRAAPKAASAVEAQAKAPPAPAPEETSRSPKRADLAPDLKTLMAVRRSINRRRPIFGRQAANRYWRIGRDGSWRAPRGLQSKQRRHYGYRPMVVRVGYRSPARVRGLVPSGFEPVLVHTANDLTGIDARRQAAMIARTVGTRRRIVLEEEARKLGIRVLNPIVTSEREA